MDRMDPRMRPFPTAMAPRVRPRAIGTWKMASAMGWRKVRQTMERMKMFFIVVLSVFWKPVRAL